MLKLELSLATALCLAVAACSGSDETRLAGAASPGTPSAERPAAAAPPGPVYLISTTVYDPDSFTTFVLTAPSLDAGTELDYSQAVGFENGASTFGRGGDSVFYVGSCESPELTRWSLADDGSLVPGDSLSFAAYGLTSACTNHGYVKFASETKAYFFDTGELRLIVWNPAEMTVTGEIDLDIEPRDALEPQVPNEMILRDDGRLLIGIHWYDYDDRRGVNVVQLLEIDTATDRVLGRHDDDRCGANNIASLAADGTAYFSGATEEMVIARRLGQGYGAIPCQLRVIPPGGSWDDSYFVDVTSLTDGKPAGDFFLLDDDVAFLRVFDEALAPPFRGDISEYALNARAYTWWRWNLNAPRATPLPGQVPGLSGSLRHRADGKGYTTQPTEDFSASTLETLSVEDGITSGITVRGYFANVIRLR